MTDETKEHVNREQRIDEIIATYLQEFDAGKNPNPFEVISQHGGEVAVELARFFSNLDQFEQLSAPLQTAAGLEPKSHFAARTRRVPENDTLLPRSTNGQSTGRFGDYELMEEIARGGMGVVYKARQISLNRTVAIKMILAGNLSSPEDLQRFHAEAEAAAGLNHPGIVPIYEVGAYEGQHYFSMAYIDGPSLAETIHGRTWESREAAGLLKQICDSVQFAHEHKVIHRDLKPANILLQKKTTTDQGSNQDSDFDQWSTLEPCITDFGLAKRLNVDLHLTGTGQILGTPGFMAPEQAAGDPQAVDAKCDIYALGAILYQMLTGRPPFQEETVLATLTQLLEEDPLPPRLLNRNLPSDLEAICMKCLAKNPSRRYASAGQLAEELTRFLDGESIQASSVNLLDRVTRVLRQSRNDEYFRGWGLGLMSFGIMIFASHIGIYFLDTTGSTSWFNYLMPRSIMFAGLLIILWRFRHHSILPTNSAERLVWVVWTGYLIALGSTNLVRSVLGHGQHESYASFAILAGLGFLVMGVHVWGGGYLTGLAFMFAAPILAVYTEFAPLLFGTLWAAGLFTFGVHYWKRGTPQRITET